MRIIGLTGGIATGKSTVATAVKLQGFHLIDCDEIAKAVVRKGRWGHKRVVAAFGDDILLEDGELDRPALGQLVFNNPELRKKLMRATHYPIFVELIWQIFLSWLWCNHSVVVDMPLLFETGFQKWTNFTILVTCSPETQLMRLMRRDNSTEEQASSRIKSQMPQDKKLKLADEIVDNNGSQAETLQQVKEILDRRAKFNFSRFLHMLLSPIGLIQAGFLLRTLLRARATALPNQEL